VKLKYLNGWNERRIAMAEKLSVFLKDTGAKLPAVNPGAKHVFHLYVVQVTERDQLRKHLQDNHIECAVHYPNPLPLLDAYKHRKFKPADYPVSSKVTAELLSLPIFPEIEEIQLRYITDVIGRFRRK
jgi:dTDP-4-amino-4,6-dideoxygalactose transaminase